MKPKWVIFDAADTLLRPEPSVASVYQRVAEEHGVYLTTEEISNRFQPAIRQYFADEISNEEIDYRRWRDLVFDVLQTSDDSAFDALWSHFAKANNWQLYQDVPPAWHWLAENGYRLAIASNFDRRLFGIVSSLPPIHQAEHVFISSQLGFRKPSSHFFRMIERELGEPPDQLMLIGDSRHADFDGASNTGWQALHLDRSCEVNRFPTIRRLTGVIEFFGN